MHLTFLFNLTSVKIECTLQVLENIAPKARLNPAMRSQALAVQMYGNAAVGFESFVLKYS